MFAVRVLFSVFMYLCHHEEKAEYYAINQRFSQLNRTIVHTMSLVLLTEISTLMVPTPKYSFYEIDTETFSLQLCVFEYKHYLSAE